MQIVNRVFTIITILLLVFTSVHAEQQVDTYTSTHTFCELENCKELKNKSIRSALSKTPYATWTIYQPSDSETAGKNIYSEKWYKTTKWFPVIAKKGDSIDLLLLHKVANKWEVALSNSRALKDENYLLVGFTIVADSYEATDNLLFCFQFRSNLCPSDQRYQYDLYLRIGEESFFSDFYYREPNMQYFSPIYGVSIHADPDNKIITYKSMASFDGYTLVPLEYNLELFFSTSINDFILSDYPVFSDLLFKEQVLSSSEDTLMYAENDLSSTVISTIPASENVKCYSCDSDWYLVIYKGTIGFVHHHY